MGPRVVGLCQNSITLHQQTQAIEANLNRSGQETILVQVQTPQTMQVAVLPHLRDF